MTQPPFWKRKSLTELSPSEWESLCDGCAKCCLHKLRDADTGALAWTNVACRLLDLGNCRCTRYSERTRLVPMCIQLNPNDLAALDWMPGTCAYRLLAEGKDLPDWHPLVSGRVDSVHEAGVSIRPWAVSEQQSDTLEEHFIGWVP